MICYICNHDRILLFCAGWYCPNWRKPLIIFKFRNLACNSHGFCPIA